MKLHMSLQTKFMLSVIVLLCALAASILFVIEKREEKAIFEEQENIGIVRAKNIATMIYSQLIQWDEEGIEESIEAEIDEKLIYVVVYDRYRIMQGATRFIKDYEEIYDFSQLDERVDENRNFPTEKASACQTAQSIQGSQKIRESPGLDDFRCHPGHPSRLKTFGSSRWRTVCNL